MTVNRLLCDEEIDKIANSLVDFQKSEDQPLPALQRQFDENRKAIDNLLNAIQQGVLTPYTKERLEALESQKEELEISILQAELQKPKYTKE